MIDKKVAVLIVAGGSGYRFGSEMPKQYFKLENNKTVLEQTVSKFLFLQNTIIYIAVQPDDKIINNISFPSQIQIIRTGGKERSITVKNSLEIIKKYNVDYILIHDAARPFISENLIYKIIKTLENNSAVLPYLKINEALKLVDNGLLKNQDRSKFLIAQTPQAFHFNEISSAYANSEDKMYFDDIEVAVNNGIKIELIEGEVENKKITFKEDIKNNMNNIRIGNGFDVHEFQEGDHVFLGGIKIPFSKGIKAHSDGDVILHSIVDALLGALGEGDIGLHFPPSDDKWKNADSQIFIKHTLDILKNKKGAINNIDITLMGEEPKISKFRDIIRKNVANLLEILENQVNIKATTTEKLGFLGRKEGIACSATCLIRIE